MPSKQPKVCVVTINWNGLKDTIECLDSLKTVEYKNIEIVVIDNGSNNSEADQLQSEFPNTKVIVNNHNLGFTGACNQGIKHALASAADYVLLLNNDTIVTPDFLTKIVNFYQSQPDCGTASPVILYNDRKRIWFAGAKIKYGITRHLHKGDNAKDIDLGQEAFKTEFVPGTCLLISTKLIKEIGILDNKYFAYYEDLDWCYRARAAGYESYVLPTAVIYHKKSSSTGGGGHSKLNKVPAYLVARNGVLFASNLHGLRKIYFLACQYVVKLPLSLLLLVKPSAWFSYIRGLANGTMGRPQKIVKI